MRLPSTRRALLVSVMEMVEAAFRSGSLSMTQIGRCLPGKGSLKSRVKKMGRRLQSDRLAEGAVALFGALAQLLMEGTSHPVLLVDWTQDNGQHLLCAAVAHDGRALPVYLEVHSEKNHGTPAVEAAFLHTLASDVVPTGCRPVVCTDMGFRSDWFDTVVALGWDYVGRLVPYVMLQPVDSDSDVWSAAGVMGLHACATPQDMGDHRVRKTAPITRRIVRFHGTTPRATSQHRRPTTRQDARHKKYRRLAKAGWVLATSLTPQQADAADIVGLYADRMQIEETFRSLKSTVYGLGANQGRSRTPRALVGLWLIGSIQAITLHCVGIVAEEQGWHRDYQTNTIRDRRVLSLITLGRLVLIHHDLRQITPQRMNRAILDIRQKAEGYQQAA